MLAVIQRARLAQVSVAACVRGAIGPGLLALVCAERGDGPAQADKLLKLRSFSDSTGKMNRSVQDIGGGLAHRQPIHPGCRHQRWQPPQLRPSRCAQ